MAKRFLSAALLLMLLFFSGALFAQKSFKAEAPNIVAEGERFLLKFVASGEISNFKRPTIIGADIIAGPSTSTSRYTSIINGKRTDSYTVTYTYVLEPVGTDAVSVSAATATIDGAEYSTSELTIEVVKSGQQPSGGQNGQNGQNTQNGQSTQNGQGAQNNQVAQNNYDYDDLFGQEEEEISYGKADLFLRLSLNKSKVVKGEPIIATVKLYTRSDIQAFEDIKWPTFDGFWSQEIEAPQNLSFVREKVGNQIYHTALIRRYMLMPQRSGTLRIEPMEMTCQVQVQQKPKRGRSFLDDFFDTGTYSVVKKKLSTGRVNVVVSELPAGAPASFGGGVGRFSISARLTKDSLVSNEAASLMVEISGSGNLGLIEAPNVVMPSDFEKYEVKSTNNFSNSAEGSTGKKLYEYPFIVRGDGEYEIAPIEYTYYDLSQRAYVTLRTEPIAIKVGKGSASSQNSVSYMPVNQRSVGNLGEDIRYIRTNMPHLKKGNSPLVLSWIFYALLLLLCALFFALSALTRRQREINKNLLLVRNRKANKVVRARLRQAKAFLGMNKVENFYEELHKALMGYISDKLSIQQSELQRDIIEDTLLSKGVSSEEIASLTSLLDHCEMVRYSPEGAAGAMEQYYSKAAELITKFESKL